MKGEEEERGEEGAEEDLFPCFCRSRVRLREREAERVEKEE